MIRQMKSIRREMEESLRKDIRKIEEIKEELKRKLENLIILEERVKEMEEKVEEINKWMIKEKDKETNTERSEIGSGIGILFSERSREYGTSKRGESSTRRTSMSSEERTSLSGRDVNIFKRIILEKEREERRNNIVIKGLTFMEKEGDKKEKVKEWLNKKLEVESNIVWCKKSGKVLVVKLEHEIQKKVIMRNKNKLKEEKIFIEDDLCWEDRKVQIGKRK